MAPSGVEFQADDDAVLTDAGEEVRIARLNAIEPGTDEIRDIADHRGHFRPLAYFEDLERHDAADLGASRGRHVGKSVLLQPAGAAFRHDATGNRIEAAGDALAGHDHVGFDAVFADGPHHAGAHEAGLHLVGDVKRVDNARTAS